MSENRPNDGEPQGDRSGETPPYSAPRPPSPRIGDAERDAAVGDLREHLSQGRLNAFEFDDRMGQALEAKTSDDLQPLFFDLPEPRPATSTASSAAMSYVAPPWQRQSAPTDPVPHQASTEVTPAQSGVNAGLATLVSLSWPIVILVTTFWLGWENFWWLIFLPVILSSVLGNSRSNRRRDRRRG